MATEDRVSKLELAQSATNDALTRLERKVGAVDQKVDAMHRVMAESELRLESRIGASEQRLGDRISATERRFVDLLNERFDAVMAVLDPLANPTK